MKYKDYKIARLELSELVSKQLSVVESSEYDEVVKTKDTPSELLSNTKERLDDENFRVLVMGKFSSGKSTFLNGLLGEKLLPMNAIPCTAVIGEIRYAEREEITLIPKQGKWEGGDEPFTITKSELKRYITINNYTEEKVENPFLKVHIKCPLNMCKQGIELVDSPGLDDPDCHDIITKEYLDKADAIIYCLHASQLYSGTDKEAIEELKLLGHTSIIFVITNFDRIVENGEEETKDFVDYAYKKLLPLSDLGKEGIFFVNSKAAMDGRITGNRQLLNSSNFLQLEDKVENILVNQKGRIKLVKSLYATKKINRENGRYMQDSISLLEKDGDKLRQMVQNAQVPLTQAKLKGDLIRSQVKTIINEIQDNANDKGSLFIMNCISKINTWVSEHTPEKGISTNPLKLKESIKEYTQSCVEHIKYRMEEESTNWSNNELSPMIQNNLKSLFLSMEDKIRAYNRDLLDVRIKLDLASEADIIAEQQNPGTFSRLASVAYTIITFDFITGAAGIAFGLPALLKTIAAQLVGFIILGIISLFTPVGIPALIITGILGAFTGAGLQFFSIKSNIKKEIIKKTKETLSTEEKKREILSKIKSAVSQVLSSIQKEVNEAVDADINTYQKLLDEASEKYTGDNQKILNKNNLYRRLLSDNHNIADNLDEFGQGI